MAQNQETDTYIYIYIGGDSLTPRVSLDINYSKRNFLWILNFINPTVEFQVLTK